MPPTLRSRSLLRRLSLLLVLALLAATPAQAAPARGGDWYERRYQTLSATLQSRLESPRAAATLLELGQLAPRLESLANLAALLKRVTRESRAHPEVRALARKLLVEVELSRGRLPRVKEQIDALDLARSGWVIGGFDNEGGTGHTTAFGPEQGPIDLNTVWPGKERDVAWRQVSAGDFELTPDLASVLRPRRNLTFYFLTSLEAKTAGRAVLHFGTSGATRLWVNGQAVFADAADHPARFDQRAVNVALRKGANLVLAKVSVLDESPSMVMRVVGLNGHPLPGARWTVPERDARHVAVTVPGPRESPAERAMAYDDLLRDLTRLAAQRPDDGELQQDLAIVLDARRPFETKDRKHRLAQEKAARLLSKSAIAQTRLAAYIDDDHNERRAALEQSLNIDPHWVPARTALGHYYVDRGFARRGHDELLKARASEPDYVPAVLGLANAFHAMGLSGQARKLELEVANERRTSPEALLAGARAEKALGRVKEAIERYRVLLSLRYDDRAARVELASLLVDTGDVDGAQLELSRALELEPSNVGIGLRLARMLSMNDRSAEAMQLFDRLAALAPDEEAVFQARGQHRLRQGDTEGALAEFQRALAIKPQSPDVRELVRSIQPQENYAQPYLRDALQLAADARSGQAPAGDPDALVLSQLDVVRVYSNGLSSRTRQEVTWLLTQRGVEQARVQGLRYAPGEEEVKIERARIIKRDGTIVESKSENDRRISDSTGGMYFDHRSRSVSLPNLEVGDVVEFTWRKDDISATNMFADYFGDVTYLQNTDPIQEVDYVLVAPAARKFFANAPPLPGLEHTVTDADDTKIWRWTAKDVPRLEPEPSMPGWVETAAYLHVSTFKEWNDVARFWWGLIREQLHVTPAVAAAAEEAVAGIPASDVKGRVRAVYNYVVSKTRYIGLEFGIHGFKPYPVDRVLARRFGDCKDKASLMYAMLGHLGIESRLVLLRMHHLGSLEEKPASLAVFNHAILYVPQLDQWLDGTAEFSGSTELPPSDQAAQVLIVEPDARNESRFLTTLVSPSTDNVTASSYDVELAVDGSATFTGTSEVKGQAASSWRRAYQSESGRREKFEQSWARNYPGAQLSSLEINDTRNLEVPVKTSFKLQVPRLARVESDRLVFSPFGEEIRYVRSYAPLSSRRYPVDLGTPWRNEFTYRVKLPAGSALLNAWTPMTARTPFGSYELQVEPTAEGITVSGHVALDASRVEPAEYPAFRAFLAEMERALGHRIAVSLPASAEVAR